ncbi:uncharacterized protein LOC132189523 [Corylus avellana]|uniref:uncharacterized protein LOC132189523 n=1 Tax=Corylus avellana TaxID=13451 RepID=UPI00286C5D83|nr:uncharacterized protein LOC132189523 [Corylus avellana]
MGSSLIPREMKGMEEFLRDNYYWNQDVYARWVENNEKVVCRMCRKPILGHAFKYMNREWFFHLPCLNAPTIDKAIMLHFGNRTHNPHDPLKFTEEVKNDGKEEVVCFGCQKAVLGPGYKCSTPQCNLLLHKSCFELPSQIQYPFHPNHTLDLVKREKKLCNACLRNCNAYPFYRCSECDFNLHITCTTHSQINIQDCQHSFISNFFNQIQFTCQACGEERKELAVLCTICQLLIHIKCALFSRIIRITSHDHSLTLTYSLRQVKVHSNLFCKLCYQKVKAEYAAYYCQECNYVTHLACAFKYEKGAHLTWLPEESVDLETNVMEVEGAVQIQHFSHQHGLILSNEGLVDDKLCDGCTGLISIPFYSCTQCDFFLHSKCAQLPNNKRYPLHPHLLTLSTTQSIYKLGSFSCKACQRLSNGFIYRCGTCDFDFDLQCCLIPETLNHKGHQHSLFLAINSNRRRCHVCHFTSDDKPCMFVCTYCDFALGFECATLPLVASHKDDDHILKLTYSAEAHCEEYYCLICEKERDPKQWFYYCAECDFSAHSQCVLGKYPYIKFGSTFFTYEFLHEHPFTFVPNTESSPPCAACGNTFDGLALECIQCKFNFHVNDDCLWRVRYLEVKNQHSIGEEAYHNLQDSSCVGFITEASECIS